MNENIDSDVAVAADANQHLIDGPVVQSHFSAMDNKINSIQIDLVKNATSGKNTHVKVRTKKPFPKPTLYHLHLTPRPAPSTRFPPSEMRIFAEPDGIISK